MSSAIDSEISKLSQGDLQALAALIQRACDSADADVADMQAQIKAEHKLSLTTKTATVVLPRSAVQALARAAEREIAGGSFPSIESLVHRAVQQTYGSR